MSRYPKRQIRAPERYEPEEMPVDDYSDDYLSEEASVTTVVKKRYRGEFDGHDDEDEGSEPNDYQTGDGFLVDDDEVDIPDDDDDEEEEEEEFDSDDDVSDDYDYDDDEESEDIPAKVYENDIEH